MSIRDVGKKKDLIGRQCWANAEGGQGVCANRMGSAALAALNAKASNAIWGVLVWSR